VAIVQEISCTVLAYHQLITSCFACSPRQCACSQAIQKSEKADFPIHPQPRSTTAIVTKLTIAQKKGFYIFENINNKLSIRYGI